MPDIDKTEEMARARLEEDREILMMVRSDRALLEEIRYKILRDKLHNQIMDLVTDAVENGKVQIDSVEDLFTLIELDLLLN